MADPIPVIRKMGKFYRAETVPDKDIIQSNRAKLYAIVPESAYLEDLVQFGKVYVMKHSRHVEKESGQTALYEMVRSMVADSVDLVKKEGAQYFSIDCIVLNDKVSSDCRRKIVEASAMIRCYKER